MSSLLNFLVESNIALAIFWLFYRTTLRHDHHFQARRIFLLFSVIFSFVIPSIRIKIPSAAFIPELPTLMLPEVIIAGDIQAVNTGITWNQWLLALYGIIAGSLILLVMVRSLRLFQLVNQANHPRSNPGEFILVQTLSGMGTFSFFRYLILDRSIHLSEKEQAQVILHESIHIRQWHSIDRLLLEFTCAIFWFNPIVWWIKKELASLHEYIADKEVIRRFTPDGYKDLLVKISCHSLGVAMANNFNQSQILNRIKIMGKEHAKSKLWKWLLGIPVVVLVCLIGCQDELYQGESNRDHLLSENPGTEQLEQEALTLQQELKEHQERMKEIQFELQHHQERMKEVQRESQSHQEKASEPEVED